MNWKMVGLISLLVLAGSGPSGARTWYVNEAGTGDAPTIPAAMDSAAYGDTVLVGPGTYYGWINMTDGVTLTSEIGPTETILTYPSAIVYFGEGTSGTLRGFTLSGVGLPGWEEGAIECWSSDGFLITGNIVTGNSHDGIYCAGWSGSGEIAYNSIIDNGRWGIFVDFFCCVHIHNNLCVGNAIGIGLSETSAEVECNDCWDNTGADYSIGLDPAPSNFSADPLFCDREAGDFTLNSCSPCLPGNHPLGYDCGLIGALGQGCDYPSRVEEEGARSWGGVKALFR